MSDIRYLNDTFTCKKNIEFNNAIFGFFKNDGVMRFPDRSSRISPTDEVTRWLVLELTLLDSQRRVKKLVLSAFPNVLRFRLLSLSVCLNQGPVTVTVKIFCTICRIETAPEVPCDCNVSIWANDL